MGNGMRNGMRTQISRPFFVSILVRDISSDVFVAILIFMKDTSVHCPKVLQHRKQYSSANAKTQIV
jgi:hypothetical protein